MIRRGGQVGFVKTSRVLADVAGGHVDYTSKAIAVTLDRPDSPRVVRALQLLTEELNATPTRLPGDHRPLTYQLAQPQPQQ